METISDVSSRGRLKSCRLKGIKRRGTKEDTDSEEDTESKQDKRNKEDKKDERTSN